MRSPGGAATAPPPLPYTSGLHTGRTSEHGWSEPAFTLLMYATFGVGGIILADLIARMSPGASTDFRTRSTRRFGAPASFHHVSPRSSTRSSQRWHEASMPSPAATAAERTSRWRSRSTFERSLSRRRVSARAPTLPSSDDQNGIRPRFSGRPAARGRPGISSGAPRKSTESILSRSGASEMSEAVHPHVSRASDVASTRCGSDPASQKVSGRTRRHTWCPDGTHRQRTAGPSVSSAPGLRDPPVSGAG